MVYRGGMLADLRATRGSRMNARSFMQEMGVDPFETPDYSAVESVDVAPFMGAAETDDYLSRLQTMNQFGLKAAASGYDVLKPRPGDKKSLEISQMYQNLYSDVDRKAKLIETGKEVQKQLVDARNKGLIVPGLEVKDGGIRIPNVNDINNVSYIKDTLEGLDKAMGRIATMAKQYPTKTEQLEADQKIEEARLDLYEKSVQRLMATNVNEEEARQIVSQRMGMAGTTYNPMEERRLALQKERNNIARAAAANSAGDQPDVLFDEFQQALLEPRTLNGGSMTDLRNLAKRNFRSINEQLLNMTADERDKYIIPTLKGSQTKSKWIVEGIMAEDGKLYLVTKEMEATEAGGSLKEKNFRTDELTLSQLEGMFESKTFKALKEKLIAEGAVVNGRIVPVDDDLRGL